MAARTVDEGVAPALVLLAAARGLDPGAAGFLVAAAAAPHVVAGPVTGAVLDASPRRRLILAAGPLLVGTMLAVLAVVVGHIPLAVALALVALAGCAGPLLTGGLSATLGDLVGAGMADEATVARAHAVDAAAYNVAGLAGPMVVAAGAAIVGSGAAGLALTACAAAAGAIIARLPVRAAPAVQDASWRRSLSGIPLLWHDRALRGTTFATSMGAFGMGALPLTVIERARELSSASAGAVLLGVLAGGALLGSLLAARIPRLTSLHVGLSLIGLGAMLAVAALAHAIVPAAIAVVVGGVADGVLISATFAVRTRHTDADQRGTVFTTAASLKIAAAAAGAALGGIVVAAVGPATALALIGATQVAGAVLPLRYSVSPSGRRPSRPT